MVRMCFGGGGLVLVCLFWSYLVSASTAVGKMSWQDLFARPGLKCQFGCVPVYCWTVVLTEVTHVTSLAAGGLWVVIGR